MKRFNAVAFLLCGAHGFAPPKSTGNRWTLRSNVVEFEMAGPSPEEMDTLLYCLGLNLAAQLPKDLKALLQEGEMDTVMKGLVDNMTGKCENANEMLQENGEKLNMLVQSRAAELQEKINAKAEEFLDEAKKKEGAIVTKGGVVVVPTEKGVGPFPTAASSVEVHYTGALMDGSVFDSSIQRGTPATFALNQVIKGWQEGLQEMQEGGKAQLLIPSDLGYGPQGQPQAGIPGGALLIFEVELKKVKSAGVGGLVL